MSTQAYFLPDQAVEYPHPGYECSGKIVPRDSELLSDDQRKLGDAGEILPVLDDVSNTVAMIERDKLRWKLSPLDTYLEAVLAVRQRVFFLIAQLADVEFPNSTRGDVERKDALEDIYKIGKVLRDLERGAKSWGARERGK